MLCYIGTSALASINHISCASRTIFCFTFILFSSATFPSGCLSDLVYRLGHQYAARHQSQTRLLCGLAPAAVRRDAFQQPAAPLRPQGAHQILSDSSTDLILTALQELKFGVEGRQHLLNGVDTLAKAVATTLGPKGRNVLIESAYGSPKITKGVHPLSAHRGHEES